MNVMKKICMKVLKKIKRKITKKDNSISKQKLFKELMKYNIISFDIFDTLITRNIYEPDDVFNIVEKTIVGIDIKEKFIDMRKKSEKLANERYKHDVNIDEIYFSMKELYGYTEDEINGMKGVEVDIEKKLISPRCDMLDLLEQLVKNGKKVILTSDMYLNKYIVEEMLKKCGYIEGKHYHKIYLSNDKNLRKDNGSMWKYFKILYSGIKFIHVGDNATSDYAIPISYGFKAICISNPKEQFRKSPIYGYLSKIDERRTIGDSLLFGYVVNIQLFNSPFNENIDSLEVLSRIHTAPIMYEFLKYIDNNTEKKDKLLFLAREGYNLQKLYKDYCKIFNKNEKNNYYFLASRKATMSTIIESKEDIVESLNKEYSGSIKTLLKNVYDVDYKYADMSIKLPDDLDKIKSKVLLYSKQIIDRSKEYKNAYIKYIDDTIEDKNNLIIVDLGYSGTIQLNLSKMLNKDLKGVYLTNSDTVKHFSNKSELLFTFDINKNKDYLRIYNYSLILEFFLSAPYGQLQYFNVVNGKSVPVYNDETMDDTKKDNIKIIYNSVIEYFKYVKEYEGLFDDLSKDYVFNLYRGIVETNIIDKKVKDKFDFMDSFNDSVKKNVFKIISKY